MRKARKNEPFFPKSLNIEPTVRCNLNCVMCTSPKWRKTWYRNKPDMSFDLFKNIVSQFPGLDKLTIQGVGEPLIHKDIMSMIEYARSLNLHTRFITNLTIFSKETAEHLVKSGHSVIGVSIDTFDPEMFADIRRGADQK